MNHLLNLIVLVGLLSCAALANRGHIEIDLISASLDYSANAYVKICIRNYTDFYTFPIEDRSACVNYTGPIASNGSKPVWNWLCNGLKNNTFSDQAQIIFEVWDHGEEKDDGKILGSSNVTIKSLLAENDNSKEIILQLKRLDDKSRGSFDTVVAWAPIP